MARQIDDATKWLKGQCWRIEPRYHPIFSLEEKDGKRILVIWAPASEAPPHQAPDGAEGPKKYWVRFRTEWGRASGRGALALLEWQHEQMGDLRAPEHLSGPCVLGDHEYAKQDAALQAVERAVDKLKASLSDCIAEPDGRVRCLLEDLARVRSRLEHAGSRSMGTGLEVAKDLTQAIVTRTDQPTEPPVNTTDSGRFVALLRDLADLNLRYLALLRPTRQRPATTTRPGHSDLQRILSARRNRAIRSGRLVAP